MLGTGPRQVPSPILCRLVHGPHWGEFLVQRVKLSSELRRCLEPHSMAFFSGSPLCLAVPKARTSPWEAPWAGPRACGKAAGRFPCRRPGRASRQLAHLCVCPGTYHPSCVYAHPGARAFKTRLAVFWVPVLVTKQCAPAQATTLTVWTSLPCPVLMAWGCWWLSWDIRPRFFARRRDALPVSPACLPLVFLASP